jgi:hypothetical protein
MTEASTDRECTEPTSDTVHRFISNLTQSLETVAWNTSRAPDNFDKSLYTACQEPDGSFARVLLSAGFKVWFAYFLASEKGQADGLDQLPFQTLGSITDRIARVSPHQSVVQLFLHLFSGQRGRARTGE